MSFCPYLFGYMSFYICLSTVYWGRRGCDRMVVGFTTTCVINAYHH